MLLNDGWCPGCIREGELVHYASSHYSVLSAQPYQVHAEISVREVLDVALVLDHSAQKTSCGDVAESYMVQVPTF